MRLADWESANDRLRAATELGLEQRRAVMWLAWEAPEEGASQVASQGRAPVDTVN